jgi:hypothetical protein
MQIADIQAAVAKPRATVPAIEQRQFKGSGVVVDPAPWVHEAVKKRFEELERSDYLGYDGERECSRRLVTDHRMQEVYGSKYLVRSLTKQGWRIWFDIARSIRPDDLLQARHALKNHADLVRELDYHMAEVGRLIVDLDELDVGEANMPRELHNALVLLDAAAELRDGTDSDLLPSQFQQFIKPSLDEMRRFEPGRYLPSVPQLLLTLSDVVANYAAQIDESGPLSSYHDVSAALASRQHAPVPEYVRLFDEAMSCYDGETNGCGFLVPSGAMALQAAVVLNLHTVDEKQIRNARSKAGARRKTDT